MRSYKSKKHTEEGGCRDPVRNQTGYGSRLSSCFSFSYRELLCSLFAPFQEVSCICINFEFILGLLVDDISFVDIFSIIMFQLHAQILLGCARNPFQSCGFCVRFTDLNIRSLGSSGIVLGIVLSIILSIILGVILGAVLGVIL